MDMNETFAGTATYYKTVELESIQCSNSIAHKNSTYVAIQTVKQMTLNWQENITGRCSEINRWTLHFDWEYVQLQTALHGIAWRHARKCDFDALSLQKEIQISLRWVYDNPAFSPSFQSFKCCVWFKLGWRNTHRLSRKHVRTGSPCIDFRFDFFSNPFPYKTLFSASCYGRGSCCLCVSFTYRELEVKLLKSVCWQTISESHRGMQSLAWRIRSFFTFIIISAHWLLTK